MARTARSHRGNPLALAVLICLLERPMHPYEIASTLRQRNKHESVRLNYGSLYGVIASLERRGLIVPGALERSGRLPERTIYEVTPSGSIEAHDWLADLVSTPVNDYPSFEAALSFLPTLSPEEIVDLLQERSQRLELELAASRATRELVSEQGLPRLFWVEAEFRSTLRDAELQYVRQLIADIQTGSLEGIDFWRQVHDREATPAQVPSYFENRSLGTAHDSSTAQGGK